MRTASKSSLERLVSTLYSLASVSPCRSWSRPWKDMLYIPANTPGIATAWPDGRRRKGERTGGAEALGGRCDLGGHHVRDGGLDQVQRRVERDRQPLHHLDRHRHADEVVVYSQHKFRAAATALLAAALDRYATDPLSSGATFWNPGVTAEIAAKKRRKNEQKWARYGRLKRVRAALLRLRNT